MILMAVWPQKGKKKTSFSSKQKVLDLWSQSGFQILTDTRVSYDGPQKLFSGSISCQVPSYSSAVL